MSVQAGPTEKRYAANGVSLAYTVPFLVIEAGDLQVFLNGVLLTSGYTHTGIGNPTSTITFSSPPTGDLYLLLSVPFQRLVDYQENGDFLATTVNRDFDRIWQALKQLLRWSGRSPVLGENDIDGAGAYRAKGNRISGLADPIDEQDATTKRWSREYLTSLISAIQGPINNALNIFFKGPDNLDYVVQDLANVSTLAKGAALIGYRGRAVKAKLDESATVDDYKLPGMTDIQAIEAMLAATGGTARLLPDRVYNLHNWTYSVATGAINIIGAGKPSSDIGYTTLSEKGASVISGHVEIRAPVVNIRDFGVDCGTARGYAHGTGCLTVDAPNGATGILFTSKNIAIMGADTTATSVSHGFLAEGFDRNEISNTDCFKLWYAIIFKGRRGFVKNTRTWMISGNNIFIKSDLPASGGNVLDATANMVIVDGLISETYAENNTCDGVCVMASTAVLATVKVRNVVQTFGYAGARVVGGGENLYCAGVELDGIKSIGTYIGVETFGTTYDVKMDNIDAENPRSGLVIKTSGASIGWQVGRFAGLFTDAAISSVYMADFGGSGSWAEATCRSGIGTKRIAFLPETVICGKTAGHMVIEGEGVLPLGSNWVAFDGDAPRLKILPGNLMKLSGRFSNTVANGTSLAAVGGGVNPGTNPDFICAGFAGGSTATAVHVRWSSAGLTLMSPALGSFGPGSFFSIDQMTLQR